MTDEAKKKLTDIVHEYIETFWEQEKQTDVSENSCDTMIQFLQKECTDDKSETCDKVLKEFEETCLPQKKEKE